MLELRNMSAALNGPELIQPIPGSKQSVDEVLLIVNIMESRMNKRIKKK
jgi:hypothetical protein